MVWLGLEPGVAGWKVQMNPLSYGGTHKFFNLIGLSSKMMHQYKNKSKLGNKISYQSYIAFYFRFTYIIQWP